MKTPNWTDPQFVDAAGVGGLNAAFGSVSGNVSSTGSGVWSIPGLLAPESMGVGFAGMVATVTLPNPWGLVTSGGVVVRAHGIQTGQNTTSYPVNFTPLVPATGSVTAYMVAFANTIQQDPFSIPGPPKGHPSFNPNFVPIVGYANNVASVALNAVTGVPDNVNIFELFRTTLTAGQVTLSSFNTVGWTRAALRQAMPGFALSAGGSLTIAEAQQVLFSITAGITSTLPSLSTAGGLTYTFVNPTSGNWTIATTGSDRIAGVNFSALAASVTIPSSGSLTVWGNAPLGQWHATSVDFYTAVNKAGDSGVGPLSVASLTSLAGIAGVNIVASGSITAAANMVAAGLILASGQVVAGGAITSQSGNITANAGKLRAAVGAFGSGDGAAATILADFTLVNTGSPGTWIRFPNGVIIQMGVTLAVPGGTVNAPVTLPTSFPTTFIGILAQYGAVPPPNGSAGASPISLSQFGIGNSSTSINNDIEWTAVGY